MLQPSPLRKPFAVCTPSLQMLGAGGAGAPSTFEGKDRRGHVVAPAAQADDGRITQVELAGRCRSSFMRSPLLKLASAISDAWLLGLLGIAHVH